LIEEEFYNKNARLMSAAAEHWAGYEIFMKSHVSMPLNDYRRIIYLLEANMRLQEYFDAVERVLDLHLDPAAGQKRKLS